MGGTMPPSGEGVKGLGQDEVRPRSACQRADWLEREPTTERVVDHMEFGVVARANPTID